ncbi:MAG: type IV toxin-antitoxin system AbiEi family antitoxin domain-containing protein [Gemmatimonadetes bacterium]|nr:type IV toxin-antitoxin system AbiEi family antitoxin domain-containing protein [Chloroflexota bacterium]MBA3584841.1 type IV toxin-antitoxin system AbiEi family antitoxin domain-containing protein [Gemmatimonadota bacterium]
MRRDTTTDTRKHLLRQLQRSGWLRRQDLDADGIHPRWLRRLQDEGVIERARAGLYRSTEAPQTADQTLFEACAAVPDGVICLTSALAYHRLTTANPSVIGMAIPRDHWRPRVTYPPIRFFEFRPRLMRLGLELKSGPQRQQLRVFSAERAICDAFRLRRIVGKDIALEALQAYLRRRSGRHVDDLLKMARETRVLRLIRPYVEVLT